MPKLLDNASATGTSQNWEGGRGFFSVVGTFGGATVTLQYQAPDASTWVAMGVGTTLTAAGGGLFEYPPGAIRALVAGGTPSALYASAWQTGRDEVVSSGVATAVTYVPSGTTTIDSDESDAVFSATAATGATTWAFNTSAAGGNVGSFTLKLTNGGSQTQTWPASVDWAGGVAPTLTAAGVDILTFFTDDGGVTWYGFAAALDIK